MQPMRHWLLAAMAGLVLTLFGGWMAAAAPVADRHFVTALSGYEEIPAVETNARGTAIFHLSKDGTELEFKLIVANIEDVFAAHLHLAPAGEEGNVVVSLLSSSPSGRTSGVIAEGTITDADLVNDLVGQSLGDLIDAIEAGDIYVNVHTTANPGGEIRGQL